MVFECSCGFRPFLHNLQPVQWWVDLISETLWCVNFAQERFIITAYWRLELAHISKKSYLHSSWQSTAEVERKGRRAGWDMMQRYRVRWKGQVHAGVLKTVSYCSLVCWFGRSPTQSAVAAAEAVGRQLADFKTLSAWLCNLCQRFDSFSDSWLKYKKWKMITQTWYTYFLDSVDVIISGVHGE